MDKKNKVKRARKTKRIKRGKPMRRKTMRRKTMRRKTMRRKTMRRKTMRRKSRKNKRYVGGSLEPFLEPFPETVDDTRLKKVVSDFTEKLKEKGFNSNEIRQILNDQFFDWRDYYQMQLNTPEGKEKRVATIFFFSKKLNSVVHETTENIRAKLKKDKDHAIKVVLEHLEQKGLKGEQANVILEQIKTYFPNDFHKWMRVAYLWGEPKAIELVLKQMGLKGEQVNEILKQVKEKYPNDFNQMMKEAYILGRIEEAKKLLSNKGIDEKYHQKIIDKLKSPGLDEAAIPRIIQNLDEGTMRMIAEEKTPVSLQAW